MAGKKQLVYKRDDDGVFRLKEKQFQEDDENNELIECTYTVSLEPSEKTLHSESNNSTYHHNKKHSVKSRSLPHPIKHKPCLSMERQKDAGANLNLHAPSFVLGAMAGAVLMTCFPQITQFTKKLFEVFKSLLIFLSVSGAICWYFGILRIEDVRQVLTYYELILNEKRQKPSTAVADESPRNHTLHNLQGYDDLHGIESKSHELIILNKSHIRDFPHPRSTLRDLRMLNHYDSKNYGNFADLSNLALFDKLQTESNTAEAAATLVPLTKVPSNQSNPLSENSQGTYESKQSIILTLPEELPSFTESALKSPPRLYKNLPEVPEKHSSSNDRIPMTSIKSSNSILGTREKYKVFISNAERNHMK